MKPWRPGYLVWWANLSFTPTGDVIETVISSSNRQ